MFPQDPPGLPFWQLEACTATDAMDSAIPTTQAQVRAIDPIPAAFLTLHPCSPSLILIGSPLEYTGRVKLLASGRRAPWPIDWRTILRQLGKPCQGKAEIQLPISRQPKPDRSLGIDGGECVDALKIENAIARQR